MLSVFFLAACSLDGTTAPGEVPFDVSPVDDAALGTLEVDGGRDAVDGAAVTLNIDLLGSSAGIVEVRPFRGDRDAVSWVGKALVGSAITSDSTTLLLPMRPPRRDRLTPTEPVIYAVALRATDPDGRPSMYIGVADLEVMWAPDGPHPGWWVVENRGKTDEVWYAPDETIELGEELLGSRRVVIDGETGFLFPPGTHLSVTTGEEGSPVNVFDVPIGPDWTAEVGFAGRLIDAGLTHGALLHFFGYLDADDDNEWTDEPVLARGCVGPNEAILGWFPDPLDLRAALKLDTANLSSGWALYGAGDDKLEPVPRDMYDSVVLREACE